MLFLDCMRKVQALIESVAFKGYGLARIDGKVVFVPYTAAGDKVWIEIVEEKKSYSLGRLDRIVNPSPWRVNPPCPYFGTCGGCQWQHIDYRLHGELKKAGRCESTAGRSAPPAIPPAPQLADACAAG